MKKTVALLLSAVMIFGLVGCAAKEATPAAAPAAQAETTAAAAEAPAAKAETPSGETFKIGCILPLSGGIATAGIEGQKSLDLAAEYINANGGFNGVPVELVYYDSTSSTEEAVKVAQKMVVQDGVNACIGSVVSGEVAATIPYLNEQKVWNFGLGTSASWMEDQSLIYTFRASPNNGIGSVSLANLLKEMGVKTTGIIYATDDVGKSSKGVFEGICGDIGLNVLTAQGCDPDETDFSGQCATLVSENPQVIYQGLVATNVGPALKQLANMGYSGFLCGMEDIGPMYYDVIGTENLEHFMVCYPYVCYRSVDECDIPAMKEYLQKFVDVYGACPTHNAGYRGWDTLMVMWEASKIAGVNETEALREATHKVKITGLGGAIDYTSGTRESYSTFNPFIFHDGKYMLFENWKNTDDGKAFLGQLQ